MRILIYDQRCKGPGQTLWLSRSFRAGARLFGGERFFDAVIPSTSWAQALRETLRVAQHRGIDEIQMWGHGKWGRALIGHDSLDASVLSPPGGLAASLTALGRHMRSPRATLWFRTCETLGANAGHDFVQRLSSQLGARVAGHTYIIGPLQSGLHVVSPGERPSWTATEGIAEGSARAPRRARWSSPRAPNTITCLRRTLPANFSTGSQAHPAAPSDPSGPPASY